MQLFIKNMVCNRCIMAVEKLLAGLGIKPVSVSLGEVVLVQPDISPTLKKQLSQGLEYLGFELIGDKNARLIAQIKTYIISHIHSAAPVKQAANWSVQLSHALGKDYSMLSKLFSSVEGITIEQYIIAQKIEKVKELLVYGELSLSEIAWQLGYSNVAHLSAQFKKITGLTPSYFKQGGNARRKTLDSI